MPYVRSVALVLACFLPARGVEFRYSKTPAEFVPYAINDAGVMAGSLGDDAAVLEDGVVRPIGSWMSASGVNSRGDVALWSGSGKSYVYADGQMQPVSIPNGRLIAAEDIDDLGRIVGHFRDFTFPWRQHAFIWEAGAVQVFDHPAFDGDSTHSIYITGCNNVGDIVGAYAGANGLQGFRYRDGGFFPTPTTGPMDINDRGQIVGNHAAGSAVFDPTGEISTIAFPGAALTAPRSIDNLGRVVGYYELPYPDTKRYGFVAVPLLPVQAVVAPRKLPPSGGGVVLVTLVAADGEQLPALVQVEIDQVNGRDVGPIPSEGLVRRPAVGWAAVPGASYRFDARKVVPHLMPGANEFRVVGTLDDGRLLAGRAEIDVPPSR